MHRVWTSEGCPQAGAAVRARVARLGLMAGAAMLAFVLAWSIAAEPARANGPPIQLRPSWVEGISNFGSRNAVATGEMITSEAELRLTTAGLEKLPDNEEYHAWISAGSERMRLVGFAVNDQGVARVDTVVAGGIPEKAWDLIVLTVEAKGSQPVAPSEKRAIAYRFSMSNPSGAAVPKVLPNTGGNQPGTPGTTGTLGLSTGGLVLLGLLVVGVIGFALGRVGARRGA